MHLNTFFKVQKYGFALNIKYFNLGAYCVQQADSNVDRTHTSISARGCELIMSVSSARLTAMQTKAGNHRSQNQEKGLSGVSTVLTQRSSGARQ